MKSLGHIRKKNSPNFLIYLVLAFLIIFSFLKFSLLKNIVKVKKGFLLFTFFYLFSKTSEEKYGLDKLISLIKGTVKEN